MSAQIVPFQFGNHSVRTVVRDGDPWFVATDVCSALEYKNSRKAVADHLDDDERCNQPLQRGGTVTLINESGLYALVLRSRKPEARRFAKWVTGEVLPAIRKTGGYGRQLDLLDHDAIKSAREAYCGWAWEAHKRLRDAGIEFPQVPEGVEQAALEAALADAMMNARFMMTFDHDFRMEVKPIPKGAMVMTMPAFAEYLANPDANPDRESVSAIAQAAVGRLARM